MPSFVYSPYSGADDAVAYRTERLHHFRRTYARRLRACEARLRRLQFSFDDLAQVHASQMRRELLFRHSLPYLLVADRTAGVGEFDEGTLSALLLAHTLSLTHLDYHLDGALPRRDAKASATVLSPEIGAAYTVRLLLEVARVVDDWCGDEGVMVRELLAEVSGFVVERMLKDSLERYDVTKLRVTESTVHDYVTSDTSRLLASGYWELMLRAGARRAGRDVTKHDMIAIRSLRRLRQIVDEAVDIEEDLRAGLATLPILLHIAQSAPEFVEQLSEEWRHRALRRDSAESGEASRLAGLIVRGEASDKMMQLAIGLWREIRGYWRGDASDALRTTLAQLADIRLTKLVAARPSSVRLLPSLEEEPWAARATRR